MKDLTLQELYGAPTATQVVYMQTAMKLPIAVTIYEFAMRYSPLYFAKEIENKERWDVIDKSTYFRELSEMRRRLYKDAPPFPGVLAQANFTNAARIYSEFVLNIRPIELAEEKRIKAKYGLL